VCVCVAGGSGRVPGTSCVSNSKVQSRWSYIRDTYQSINGAPENKGEKGKKGNSEESVAGGGFCCDYLRPYCETIEIHWVALVSANTGGSPTPTVANVETAGDMYFGLLPTITSICHILRVIQILYISSIEHDLLDYHWKFEYIAA
jgi:hypothetical protein